MSILVSALLGAIGGAVGWLLWEKLLKARFSSRVKESTLRILSNLTMLIVVLIFVFTWLFVIEPKLGQSVTQPASDQATLEKALSDSSAGELFSTIKHYDPSGYSSLIDQLTRLAGDEGAQAEGLARAAIEIGASYTQTYFQTASISSLYLYLQRYRDFLNYHLERDPLAVCQIENPQVFGVPDESVVASMQRLGLFENLGAVIQSSLQSPYPYNEAKAFERFSDFVVSYQNSNPRVIEVFGLSEVPKEADLLREVAQTYFGLYQAMLALPQEDATLVYRYMRGGQP